MRRSKTAALVFLVMLTMAMALPSAVAAKGPQQFSAWGIAAIASPPTGFPAGASGRYVTAEETVMAALKDSDWGLLKGAYLVVGHTSNARFQVDYSYGFPLITHVDSGTSHGKFTLVASDGVTTYQGSYETKISTVEPSDQNPQGCTIFDSGTWTIASGSVQAHGTLSVCLNFGMSPMGALTYWGPVTLSGQHN